LNKEVVLYFVSHLESRIWIRIRVGVSIGILNAW